MVRNLGIYILILGLIMIIYGGLKYASNQPEKFDQSKSEMTPFGGRNDLGNLFNVKVGNMEREVGRRAATGCAIIGLAVSIFGGILANGASKKNVTKND